MDTNNLGLHITQPLTHGIIRLEPTIMEYCKSSTKKDLLMDILSVLGFYFVKLILCISLFIDLCAGYFLLVNKFNLDSWQMLHVIVGCYMALAVIFLWELLNGLIE